MYRFRNKNCPVCNKPIDPYFYVLNKKGKKVHIECQEESEDADAH